MTLFAPRRRSSGRMCSGMSNIWYTAGKQRRPAMIVICKWSGLCCRGFAMYSFSLPSIILQGLAWPPSTAGPNRTNRAYRQTIQPSLSVSNFSALQIFRDFFSFIGHTERKNTKTCMGRQKKDRMIQFNKSQNKMYIFFLEKGKIRKMYIQLVLVKL